MWPVSVWSFDPVEMSQSMILASAEPEMRVGVELTIR